MGDIVQTPGPVRLAVKAEGGAPIERIDVLNGREMRVTMDELRTAATAYQNERNAEKLAAAEKNRATGEAFLKENGTRNGVVVLDSGLQYRIIEPGNGEAPTETDTVVVHYIGRLLNGKQFDSSVARGQPIKIPIGMGRVIKGWDEGIMDMTKGERRTLIIPPDLGYGARGYPGAIPPNATLIFETELVDF